jgi:hypothetical protein
VPAEPDGGDLRVAGGQLELVADSDVIAQPCLYAVTMNIYAHVVQETQREAVSHLDRMLKRRPVVNDCPG